MTQGPFSDSRDVRAPEAACAVLTRLGADCVFGLPGTQNLQLTEALRRSELRLVVPSHELSAAFMANGHYRSSGRPGVLTTIPGPGFTWALTGLAEARLDSAAVLCITGVHPEAETSAYGRLQEIPQSRIARPLVKDVLRVQASETLPGDLRHAYRLTTQGEPGPVLVEIEHPVWDGLCSSDSFEVPAESGGDPTSGDVGGVSDAPRGRNREMLEEIAGRLESSERPVLFVGQGAQEGAEQVRRLAERLKAPVLLTTSGRGVVPESHPLAVPIDSLVDPAEVVNRRLEASDLVLVLGCRLSHNATLGFQLQFPEDVLIRVDASEQVLQARTTPGALCLQADVTAFLDMLLARMAADDSVAKRSAGESKVGELAAEGVTFETSGSAEPRVSGFGDMSDFFRVLRDVLPPGGVVVTDSGLHQMLVRRHFRVEASRTLVVPTNFQSMGYGIPAAIGAALANPGRPVVAVVGDGGLRLSAFDLAVARDLGVDLTALVFVDGHLGLIRRHQLTAFGHESGVDLADVDLAPLAESLGIPHRRVTSNAEEQLSDCLAEGGVHLVEVAVDDARGLWAQKLDARLRGGVRHALGPRRMDRIRKWRDRMMGHDSDEP